MTISILLAQQIAQLFLMIFMGFLIVKAGLLKDEDSKVLSKIVLYLIIPCVILNAFQVDYTPETVRGLLVEVRDLYEVRSNRESGYGRYDVILIPRNLDRDAMILEFKVKETEEKTLQETVQKALAQIEIKKYDAELKERGIPKERIRHYGFAFEGKKVLIG